MNEFDVHQLAKDIAYCMRWDYPEQDGWNAHIHGLDGRATLWIANERGRVRISGGFGELHKYLPYDSRGKHEIGVSPTKTPPQIVNDIRRRLLPKYFEDLQIVEQRHAEHVERMKGIANAALKFGAILNTPPPEVSEEEVCRIHLGFIGEIWGDITIGIKDVDIKLTDVPFEIAAMMLVPIGEYIRAHPKEKDDVD